MNIGPYTFEEFKQKAKDFHGYPAPGLLIGGYMVEAARSLLPKDILFEAIVETGKCLPDAVQILTPLSTGNSWMKVVNLGRYALSLYDKYTGEGHRIFVDTNRLDAWPEIKAWFLKLKPKQEQDSARLFQEIEEAGHTICSTHPVRIPKRFFHKHGMREIRVCPACNEAYPASDGGICRGCQGEAPYAGSWQEPGTDGEERSLPPLRAIPVEEAVGKTALHDMTRIAPGESKGPEFTAGQTFGVGDLCRLQQMGRNRVYVAEEDLPDDAWVHENDAVLAFARRMAGQGVAFDESPSEGKINFTATRDGLLCLDREKLTAFNLVPDVMCATRQGDLLVDEGKFFAGCRAIPLYLSRQNLNRALAVLGQGPLFEVLPLRKARIGVLVTGTEVFQGLIEDKFEPVIRSKAEALGSEVAAARIAPDDRAAITNGVRELLDQGCDMIVTTAGLSVDPDDVTRAGLVDAGLTDALYGMPVLPGTMTLLGRLRHAEMDVPVLGVPACALFYKTTSLDLLLPRILAGQEITRRDLAALGEGGFCLSCKSCTFPKCPFGK
ncbi:MAG: FmdE family protein [Desulfovibrionaceae bacterium]